MDLLAVAVSGSGALRATLVAGSEVIGSWVVNTSGADLSHNTVSTGTLILRKGTQYSLEFSADSGALEMGTYRDGTLGLGYTYALGGSWHDGHSQFTDGGAWTDTFFTYADLKGVAFRVVG